MAESIERVSWSERGQGGDAAHQIKMDITKRGGEACAHYGVLASTAICPSRLCSAQSQKDNQQ